MALLIQKGKVDTRDAVPTLVERDPVCPNHLGPPLRAGDGQRLELAALHQRPAASIGYAKTPWGSPVMVQALLQLS